MVQNQEEIFEQLRKKMIKEQIEARGIKDKRVIETMLKIPRHIFVCDELKSKAYEDYPLPIGHGQTISQPYIIALMTEVLELNENDKVLEIGTGSGYQTAILASLVKYVVSIERIEALARQAQQRLESLGFKNIKIVVGNGSLGAKGYAPFDKIMVTAAVPEIPPPLCEQLKENGIIVLPKGDRLMQSLLVVKKTKKKLEIQDKGGCLFVPLIGEYGFRETNEEG